MVRYLFAAVVTVYILSTGVTLSLAESVTLKWPFKGNEFTWTTEFRNQDLQYYRSRPRPRTIDYSIYASDSTDDRYMKELTALFRKIAGQNNFSRREAIEFVTSFVQHLPYTSDNVTSSFDEYPRFPLETLIEKGGDCEDTAILAATLLKEMGFDVVLIALPRHMAVGVDCGDCSGTYFEAQSKKYYYVETTATGWELGSLPRQYEGYSPRLLPLVPQPIVDAEFSHRRIETLQRQHTYEVIVKVANEGSQPARNLKIWTAFAAEKQGMVYSQLVTEPSSLPPSGEITNTITLPAPRNARTRLLIKVFGDNFISRAFATDWMETD